MMDERLLNPISTAELERRWAAARKAMAERSIDALVMQNSNDFVGGYVRWFTDTPLTDGYIPRSVIFPASDLMTVVDMGGKGINRKLDGGEEANRGVGEMMFTPAFASVAFTHEYQAELVAGELARRGYRTVGWVGSGAMPHRFVVRVESELEGKTRFVDATECIDRLKAIKSEEERELVRKCAAMQDLCFDRVLKKIRPGMTDNEVTALAEYEGRVRGSVQGVFLGSSAPLGQASRFLNRRLQGRRIRPGEHYSLLIENNGPGGMYTEIARTIVLGKASNELIDGFESMKEVQAHTLRQLKPGASCAEIAGSHDAYMRARGLPPELRLYAHGQGYDLVERPLIRADETMRVEEHMNFAVHPGYETASIFAVICDNYLIEADGPGSCLHRTPKQIFEV
jgi:Xaa-Pro aminopeptidase